MLDVSGYEPGHLAARRALRLDQQPQLRRTPGQGRAYAPSEPGRRGGDGGNGPLRLAVRARRPRGGEIDGPRKEGRGQGAAPRPGRRGHGPDRPERRAQTYRAYRLRPVTLL